MQKFQQASKFGDVREISAQDYVDQVNKAGKGVWVVLHLYKTGYPFVIDIFNPVVITYHVNKTASYQSLHLSCK